MIRVILSVLILFCSFTVYADDFIKKGDALSVAGDWDHAIEAYQQAAAHDPDSSIAFSRIGGALLATQRYSDSVGFFQKAISKNANNHGAFIGLGISYLHMGRYDLSRAALLEARRLAPGKREDIDSMLVYINKKMPETARP